MTTNELIELLKTVKDKDKEIYFTGIVGMDFDCRNKYEYFYKAKIWDSDITNEGPTLVIE